VDKRLAAMTDWSSLPVLLTVAEAALVLRVNAHTVYELVRQHIESPHPLPEPSFALEGRVGHARDASANAVPGLRRAGGCR